MMSNRFNIAYTGFWVLVLIGILVWNGCKPKTIDEDSSYTKIATVTEDDEVIAVEVDNINAIGLKRIYKRKDYYDTFDGTIHKFNRNGMDYILLSNYDGGAIVVNLTKDSLKVEKLKRELLIEE